MKSFQTILSLSKQFRAMTADGWCVCVVDLVAHLIEHSGVQLTRDLDERIASGRARYRNNAIRII
jgi:hypothetical protein